MPIFQQSVKAELYEWLLRELKRRKVRQDFDSTLFVVREKYVLVRQPIPKRPPHGLNLPRLMWTICKRWNDEFLKKYDS